MGKERRQHHLFVTRHTEYHLRLDECVGVRDRGSGRWYREHAALRLRAMRVPGRGAQAWLGERLQFFGNNTDVVTSEIVQIGRPRRDALEHYTSLVKSGSILA